MKNYKITKTINNNVSFSKDGTREIIIFGKGIAFGKKAGDEVPASSVDKIFTIADDRQKNAIVEMVENISFPYVELAIRIVELYEKEEKEKLNQMMIISLADHIENAVDNMKEGIAAPNEMLNEIRRLYRKEYQIALEGLKLIEAETGIRLPEAEAGFIVLHYLNASGKGPNREMKKRMKFVGRMVRTVETYFQIALDTDSFYYQRFITHLTFFASRLFGEGEKSLGDDNFVYGMIREKYPEVDRCVSNIAEIIQRDYGKQITEEEKGYLIIHIQGMLKEKE